MRAKRFVWGVIALAVIVLLVLVAFRLTLYGLSEASDHSVACYEQGVQVECPGDR